MFISNTKLSKILFGALVISMVFLVLATTILGIYYFVNPEFAAGELKFGASGFLTRIYAFPDTSAEKQTIITKLTPYGIGLLGFVFTLMSLPILRFLYFGTYETSEKLKDRKGVVEVLIKAVLFGLFLTEVLLFIFATDFTYITDTNKILYTVIVIITLIHIIIYSLNVGLAFLSSSELKIIEETNNKDN